MNACLDHSNKLHSRHKISKFTSFLVFVRHDLDMYDNSNVPSLDIDLMNQQMNIVTNIVTKKVRVQAPKQILYF